MTVRWDDVGEQDLPMYATRRAVGRTVWKHALLLLALVAWVAVLVWGPGTW